VHWILFNKADCVTLKQAVSDVNRASLGAPEIPDAFAAHLPDLGEACGNMYGEDLFNIAFIQGLSKKLQVGAQQYELHFPGHALQQLPLFTQGNDEQVKALQRLQLIKMYLARLSSREGPKTPVLAVGDSSSKAGGRLEGCHGFVTPSTPRVARGGERPNRVRACWLCNNENDIAAACQEVPKQLQDKPARQGIQFSTAVPWAVRQDNGVSPGRRAANTVHNLRVAAKYGLHLAHEHHKRVQRHESFSVLLVNLVSKTKMFAKGTRMGVAEPYTGEEPPLSQGALLAVQQEMTARQELETQAALATVERPPENPVVPPFKEPETPDVNWAGVPKELHAKVHGLLDQFKGMWSGKLGEIKAATHHIELTPDAKPVY